MLASQNFVAMFFGVEELLISKNCTFLGKIARKDANVAISYISGLKTRFSKFWNPSEKVSLVSSYYEAR